MELVTIKELETAKKEALAAIQQAFGPAHNVNGEYLCWSGRMTLAMGKGNQALQDENDATLAAINDGINVLSRSFARDNDIAEKKVGYYIELERRAGNIVTKESLMNTCGCPGCKRAEAQVSSFVKFHEMRESVQALLFPNAERGTSILYEMVKANNKEDLWRILQVIAKVQEEYLAATSVLGNKPEWSRVLT